MGAMMSVTAQDLHKEITVEREITPIEREATRLNMTPLVSLPAVKSVSLRASEQAVAARVRPLASFLEPAAYADTLYTSPYRGYVAGGIFPLPFNAGVSAGYKFVDNDRMRLTAWMQFDSENYKRKPYYRTDVVDSKDNIYWRENTVAVGADFRVAVGKVSTLGASLDYMYNRAGNYESAFDTDETYLTRYYRTATRLNARIGWISEVDALDYTASFNFRRSAYGKHHPLLMVEDPQGPEYMRVSPVAENNYTLNLLGTLPFSDEADVHLGADLSLLHRGEGFYPAYISPDMTVFAPKGSGTDGLLSLTPGYRYGSTHFTVAVGARLDISFNEGKVFHVSPDVTVAWTPSTFFAIEGRVTGGVEQNSLSTLWDVSRYCLPAAAYGYSHVPFDVSGKVTIGPFKGGYLQFFGSYAKASDWLMPVAGDESASVAMFVPVGIKGYHLGAEIGYKWRDKIKARVSYTTAPQDYDKGYYQWRDRARHVVDVSLTVNPVKNLDVEASFMLRGGRKIITRENWNDGGIPMSAFSTVMLKNRSSLSLRANYALSERLSVFASGDNLLNHTSYDISLRPDMGISFLVGAAYKF